MEIKEVGYRYRNRYLYKSKQDEYDFRRNGILNKLMSSTITNSESRLLQWFLNILDTSFIYIISYIDRLKNFKNYIKINR